MGDMAAIVSEDANTRLPFASQQSTLLAHRIPELPSSGCYIPDFITEEQEQHVIQEISRVPEGRWTVLSHRRLLSLPSQLTGPAKDKLLDAPMPVYLTRNVLDKFQELRVFNDSPHKAPNHCLVNEYESGQGIMPHEDGPAYFPITATVTLASHTVLDIYKKNEAGERESKPTWRILQEPRSLLVTTGYMYKDTLHGISNVQQDSELGPETIVNWELLGNRAAFESGTVDRQTRISLTYRDVAKVAKVGSALKFMSKK